MPRLTLYRKQLFKVGIPLWVYVDGQPIGIMKEKEVSLHLPPGSYDVGVKVLLQFFKWQFHVGGTTRVDIRGGENQSLEITDKERLWNILFDIDLVLCILKLFLDIPSPWGLVYEIVSDGFFVIWLLRVWIIRERYYILKP